jgi:hypothetical protein
VAVMAVVSTISIRAVVAACGFVSVPPPATTGAKVDAYDHQDNDHDRDKKHSHPDPPFSGLPEFGPDFTHGRSGVTNQQAGLKHNGRV